MVVAPWAVAGVVRTLDGKTVEGQIGLEDRNQLSVRAAGGTVSRVELGKVFSAQFKAVESATSEPGPGRWVGRDIGQPVPGSARFVGDAVTVRGSGGGNSGGSDSGYFVSQPMTGDGQIVARLASVQETDRQARAGVMIRAGMEAGVPYGMMLAYAGGGVRLQYRERIGASSQGTDMPNAKSPCWLKLVRKGEMVSGFWSEDGQSWELVGSQRVTLPATVRIGLAVCSNNANAVCTATFERVMVTTGAVRGDGGGATSQGSGGGAIKGVLLRQGSLVGGQIGSANDSVVKIGRDREWAVPMAEVARIYFATVKADAIAKLQAGRKGVLLGNGDFFEGQVQGIEGGRVKLNSVLFGLKWFDVGQVAAAVVQDVSRSASRYEVRLADGSELLAEEVRVDKGLLVVEDRAFGVLKSAADQVVEIRLGQGRFVSLSDLKPAAVEGEPAAGWARFVADGVIGGGRMSLGGQAYSRGLGLMAGTSVRYGLDGSYSLLVFRAGVPDGVLPAAGVRLVVRGDGKELYRSPDRTSVDDAIAVTLVVSGVKSLVLSVEGGSAGVVGGSGVFAEAVLVK